MLSSNHGHGWLTLLVLAILSVTNVIDLAGYRVGFLSSQALLHAAASSAYKAPTAKTFGSAFQDSVQFDQYQYYSFQLSAQDIEAQADVQFSVFALSGLVDMFANVICLECVHANNSEANPSVGMSALVAPASQSGQTLRITAREGLYQSNGSIIIVGVRGFSTSTSSFILDSSKQVSQMVDYGVTYRRTIPWQSWHYYRLQLLRPSNSVFVRVQQTPKSSLGLRVAYAQDRPVNPVIEKQVQFADANGVYELQVHPVMRDRTVLYFGIQAMFPPVQGSSYNYTLQLSPYSITSEGFVRTPKAYNDFPQTILSTARGSTAITEQATPGDLIHFSFHVPQGGQTAKVTVVEDLPLHTPEFVSNSSLGVPPPSFLRVMVLKDHPASPVRFNVSSPESSSMSSGQAASSYDSSSRTHILDFPAVQGSTYFVAVLQWSYHIRHVQFHIAATVFQTPLVPPPFITPLANNFRFFETEASFATYTYFSVAVPSNSNDDLGIFLRNADGLLDLFVSTSHPYPSRADAMSYQWSSLAEFGQGKELVIFRSDPHFIEGTYYIAIYARANVNFQIAAALDPSPVFVFPETEYGFRTRTYTFKNFAIRVPFLATRIRISVTLSPADDLATLLANFGRKPNQFSTPDRLATRNNTLEVEFEPAVVGVYYMMVHFFPSHYFGEQLEHHYSIIVDIDTTSAKSFVIADGYGARATHPEPQGLQRVSLPRRDHAPRTVFLDGQASSPLLNDQVQLFRLEIPSQRALSFIRVDLDVRSADGFSPPLTHLLIRRGIAPIRLASDSSNITTQLSDRMGAQYQAASITVLNPPGGAIYFIGVQTVGSPPAKASRTLATVAASSQVAVGERPEIFKLQSFFFRLDRVTSLNYIFYKLEVDSDFRDVLVVVQMIKGNVRLSVSNDIEYPRLSDTYNSGWISSSDSSEQANVVLVEIFSFDPSFRKGVFYASVFAYEDSEYLITARIQQPPPQLEPGNVYGRVVSLAGWVYFRYYVQEPQGFLRFVVRAKDWRLWSSTGTVVNVAARIGSVPTLGRYTAIESSTDANGTTVLKFFPKARELYYLGVFIVPGPSITTGSLGALFELRTDGMPEVVSEPYEDEEFRVFSNPFRGHNHSIFVPGTQRVTIGPNGRLVAMAHTRPGYQLSALVNCSNAQASSACSTVSAQARPFHEPTSTAFSAQASAIPGQSLSIVGDIRADFLSRPDDFQNSTGISPFYFFNFMGSPGTQLDVTYRFVGRREELNPYVPSALDPPGNPLFPWWTTITDCLQMQWMEHVLDVRLLQNDVAVTATSTGGSVCYVDIMLSPLSGADPTDSSVSQVRIHALNEKAGSTNSLTMDSTASNRFADMQRLYISIRTSGQCKVNLQAQIIRPAFKLPIGVLSETLMPPSFNPSEILYRITAAEMRENKQTSLFLKVDANGKSLDLCYTQYRFALPLQDGLVTRINHQRHETAFTTTITVPPTQYPDARQFDPLYIWIQCMQPIKVREIRAIVVPATDVGVLNMHDHAYGTTSGEKIPWQSVNRTLFERAHPAVVPMSLRKSKSFEYLDVRNPKIEFNLGNSGSSAVFRHTFPDSKTLNVSVSHAFGGSGGLKLEVFHVDATEEALKPIGECETKSPLKAGDPEYFEAGAECLVSTIIKCHEPPGVLCPLEIRVTALQGVFAPYSCILNASGTQLPTKQLSLTNINVLHPQEIVSSARIPTHNISSPVLSWSQHSYVTLTARGGEVLVATSCGSDVPENCTAENLHKYLLVAPELGLMHLPIPACSSSPNADTHVNTSAVIHACNPAQDTNNEAELALQLLTGPLPALVQPGNHYELSLSTQLDDPFGPFAEARVQSVTQKVIEFYVKSQCNVTAVLASSRHRTRSSNTEDHIFSVDVLEVGGSQHAGRGNLLSSESRAPAGEYWLFLHTQEISNSNCTLSLEVL